MIRTASRCWQGGRLGHSHVTYLMHRNVRVDGVQAFGCFVDVLPGKGGLVHVRCPLDCVSSWNKHADWQ